MLTEAVYLLFFAVADMVTKYLHGAILGNHPKQAGLTWPKKKKSQGIILAISYSNKATSL